MPDQNIINFSQVAVILERCRRYSPEEFINQCFKQHNKQHRKHLLTKVPTDGNILGILHKLDLEHMREVNQFLNSLLPQAERIFYNQYI